MNKVQISGLVILLFGMAAHFIMDMDGFWIGGSLGLGIGLLVTGKLSLK